MENGIVTVESYAAPMQPDELQKQVNAIQRAMQQVMQLEVHYGKIPGCGDKPSLFKPGAEKICLMFRLIASFEIRRSDLAGGHREYEIVCTLKDLRGQVVGQGVGCCGTMESKYRYRNASRKCPECGAEAIIKGKEQYGGGWVCYKKKDGCGAKFHDDDKGITEQETGKIENADLADCYNTVLKMAKKRAHVDATITTTAAGDIFTQDIEDLAASAPEQPVVAVVNEAGIDNSACWHYSLATIKDAGMRKEIQKELKASGAKPVPELNAWVSKTEIEGLKEFCIYEPNHNS